MKLCISPDASKRQAGGRPAKSLSASKWVLAASQVLTQTVVVQQEITLNTENIGAATSDETPTPGITSDVPQLANAFEHQPKPISVSSDVAPVVGSEGLLSAASNNGEDSLAAKDVHGADQSGEILSVAVVEDGEAPSDALERPAGWGCNDEIMTAYLQAINKTLSDAAGITDLLGLPIDVNHFAEGDWVFGSIATNGKAHYKIKYTPADKVSHWQRVYEWFYPSQTEKRNVFDVTCRAESTDFQLPPPVATVEPLWNTDIEANIDTPHGLYHVRVQPVFPA